MYTPCRASAIHVYAYARPKTWNFYHCSYPTTSASVRTNRALRRPATPCPARCGKPINGARWECMQFSIASKTHPFAYAAAGRDASGDTVVPRSYHLRAKTLSLLAAITDLGACVGSSRKHITHTYGTAFAISTASFTAERTCRPEGNGVNGCARFARSLYPPRECC